MLLTYRLLPLMGIAWVVFSVPIAIANTNLGSIREGENPEIQANKGPLAPVVMASASTEEQKYRQTIDKDPNDVESYSHSQSGKVRVESGIKPRSVRFASLLLCSNSNA